MLPNILRIKDSMWTKSRKILEPYQPPEWARCLKVQPKVKVKLANTPTPIQYWPLPGLPEGVDVFIKREDMTGSTLTGNKARKLEFLLADAIAKGYTDVITVGWPQSNHIRCTTMAARELGLQTHCVYVCGQDVNKSAGKDFGGNLFLTKLAGGIGYFAHIDANKDIFRNTDKVIDKIKAEVREDTGCECYHIPLGGSNALSSFAYIDVYQEMLDQGLTDNITDIVVIAGSGGTPSALAVSNYLTNGYKIKIHGVTIALEIDTLYNHTDSLLDEMGIYDVRARDILFMKDYRGEGYTISTKEERDFIAEVGKATGIALDTTYTGKAAYGMVQDLKCNPESFKGSQILFIHSGGIYANFTTPNLQDIDQSIDWVWKVVQTDDTVSSNGYY